MSEQPKSTEQRAASEQPAPDALSYEQARDELTKVVAALEAGTTTLEESLDLWERGEKLVGICQRWLDSARVRIEAVRNRDAQSGDAGATDSESE
ncbi:MAG: exodeoxyribonuclease VII small subunit [Candidatus Nanopelagicales bacterium]